MKVEMSLASPAVQALQKTGGAASTRFGEVVSRHLEDLNKIQLNADALTEKLATGGDVELHQVMMAAEEARLMMDFTLGVRNKLIDAYQEIMRMPM